MNPYEAPQSSLDREEPRSLPTKSERSFIRELFCSAIVGVLIFGVIVTGLLIAHRVAVALGYANDLNVADTDAKMHVIVLAFSGFSWALWRNWKEL